jgi:hypothetical protein
MLDQAAEAVEMAAMLDGCHKQETQGRRSRWEEPQLAVLACFERFRMLKQRRDNVLTHALSQCTVEFTFTFIASFLFRNVSSLSLLYPACYAGTP